VAGVPEGRVVRHTVIRLIAAPLQADPPGRHRARTGAALTLTFTSAEYGGGDFDGTAFTDSTVNFAYAKFGGGTVDFSGSLTGWYLRGAHSKRISGALALSIIAIRVQCCFASLRPRPAARPHGRRERGCCGRSGCWDGSRPGPARCRRGYAPGAVPVACRGARRAVAAFRGCFDTRRGRFDPRTLRAS
jgi:hypothetical protein